MEYKDILYETRGSAVWITINRPDKYNAFRGVTCEELIHAITRAGWGQIGGGDRPDRRRRKGLLHRRGSIRA
jgi:hypothetical protein